MNASNLKKAVFWKAVQAAASKPDPQENGAAAQGVGAPMRNVLGRTTICPQVIANFSPSKVGDGQSVGSSLSILESEAIVPRSIISLPVNDLSYKLWDHGTDRTLSLATPHIVAWP